MRHCLYELLNQKTVLAGSIAGRRALSKLIEATPQSNTPTIAYLDFAHIDVATSSFLREAVVGFRNYTRNSAPNIYAVAANLAPSVYEELAFFVSARNDVLWSCELDANNRVTAARLIGELDPAQKTTFDAVRMLRTATAPDLTIKYAGEGIGATAWNNRLSLLVSKGLLVEQRNGKLKSFSPLLEIA